MRKFTADKVFINNILKNDIVIVTNDEGKILSVDSIQNHDETEVKKFHGYLIPGFINAHCHLELSYLKNQITPNTQLVGFVIELLSKRFSVMVDKEESFKFAEEEMKRNGIVAVGDISNVIDTVSIKGKSSLKYHTFVEVLGFKGTMAEQTFNESAKVFQSFTDAGLNSSIVPHAPYSLSRKLFSLINDWQKKNKTILSIHNEESQAELDFCFDGTGDFNKLLKFLNYNSSVFQPYQTRSLQGVWDNIKSASQRILVHNTFSNEEDFKLIKENKDSTWLCTCPNANLYIENKLPGYKLWMKHTENICIGTDSLASNHQLSVWEEMKTIHQYNPEIQLQTLLQWATLNGARALRLDKELGSIEINKKPGIVLLEQFSAFQVTEVWEFIPRRII